MRIAKDSCLPHRVQKCQRGGWKRTPQKSVMTFQQNAAKYDTSLSDSSHMSYKPKDVIKCRSVRIIERFYDRIVAVPILGGWPLSGTFLVVDLTRMMIEQSIS